MKHLRQTLLRGVLFMIPWVVMLFVLELVSGWSMKWLGRVSLWLVQRLAPESLATSPFFYGLVNSVVNLVILVIVVYVLGLIASVRIGKNGLRLSDLIDYPFKRIPGLRTVYSAVRKMTEAMGDSAKTSFKRVVLIPSPLGPKGAMAVVFVTKELIDKHTGQKFLGVLLPTPPNPFSGFPFVVPAECAIDPGMTMEEGFKAVASFNVLLPDELYITAPAPAQENNKDNAGPGGSSSA